MTWDTDDRRLYWEQRKLDEEQARAKARMDLAKRMAQELDISPKAALASIERLEEKGLIEMKSE
jgi:predicted ArsR family transcriptional regulator